VSVISNGRLQQPKDGMVESMDTRASVKVVGQNGQISLGKEFAGRQVLVEEREPGVWLIRTAKVIPENELWLHQPQASEDMRRALAWVQANPPRESAPDTIFEKLANEQRTKRKARQARPK
jgi:hypothetical protein